MIFGEAEVARTLALVAQRDALAFVLLHQQLRLRLYNRCYAVLGRADEAEDAVQQCFASVWLRADSFAPERGTALGWLDAVARNAALDQRRKRRSGIVPLSQEVSDTAQDPAPLASAVLEELEQVQRLADTLASLDPLTAKLIARAHLEGVAHTVLAAEHALPLGTVKSRIRRGLLTLRAAMSTDPAPST